jgi:hypothetical protein
MTARMASKASVSAARGARLSASETQPSSDWARVVGHSKTLTFVAGLRQSEIAAPFVIELAMNGAAVIDYVRRYRRSGPAISS